jgi:hypothetical protein
MIFQQSDDGSIDLPSTTAKTATNSEYHRCREAKRTTRASITEAYSAATSTAYRPPSNNNPSHHLFLLHLCQIFFTNTITHVDGHARTFPKQPVLNRRDIFAKVSWWC